MQVILPSTADVGFGFMAEKVVHQPGFGRNDGFSQVLTGAKLIWIKIYADLYNSLWWRILYCNSH